MSKFQYNHNWGGQDVHRSLLTSHDNKDNLDMEDNFITEKKPF